MEKYTAFLETIEAFDWTDYSFMIDKWKDKIKRNYNHLEDQHSSKTDDSEELVGHQARKHG